MDRLFSLLISSSTCEMIIGSFYVGLNVVEMCEWYSKAISAMHHLSIKWP